MLARLDELPRTMQESGRRANTYENAILNLMEAATGGRFHPTDDGQVLVSSEWANTDVLRVVLPAGLAAQVAGSSAPSGAASR
mgnify:CR=1 FL=1